MQKDIKEFFESNNHKMVISFEFNSYHEFLKILHSVTNKNNIKEFKLSGYDDLNNLTITKIFKKD